MTEIAALADVLSGVMPQDSLLATKLYLPRPRPGLVARPRLTARLNQGLAGKLILISAPAGFGKTTLLSEWLTDLRLTIDDLRLADELKIVNRQSKIQNLRVAWLSLDEADNDPVRFWAYFTAALRTSGADLNGELAPGRRTAPLPPPEVLLTPLINEIAASPDNFVLVLDDYHLIETEAIHQALTFLLDNLPPQMRLILAGRTDPPLPLARLRARGQLIELRTGDLRFTPAEVATFLNQVMELPLSAGDMAILETRTEGWIAGLQLAALSMQGCQDIPSFIAAFNGSHRYILDYLAEEVLNRQPQDVQTFLLQTSILNRLCGPLCNAVVSGFGLQVSSRQPETRNPQPETNSQAMLEYLAQANLFIVPLDDERRWYRYHHLFADLLRNRLRQTQPERIPELHRRAAEWYERHELIAEAVGHALAIADVERAARLVEQSARTLLSRSELATLLSWLKALPDELVQARPRLSLFQAWALVLTGRLEAVEAWLQDAETRVELPAPGYGPRGFGFTVSSFESFPQTPNPQLETSSPELEIQGELAAIRATVAYFRRDLPGAIAGYRQALDLLPEANQFLRGAVALSLGVAYSWSGQIVEASQALAEASAISQATGNLHATLIALWNLAQLHGEQGHLRQAGELYQQAMQLVAPLSSEPVEAGTRVSALIPAAGGAYVGMAGLLYERNDLVGAERYVLQGLKLGEQGAEVGMLTMGYMTLARVKQAQGNLAGALEVMQKAEQLAQGYNSAYWAAQAAAGQARLWLAQHNLAAVEAWAQPHSRPGQDFAGYPGEGEQLILARLFIAQGRLAEAVDRLAQLRPAAEAAGRMGRVIEILILTALAHQAGQEPEPALAALQQALRLAEPEGYVRLFLDEGAPLIALLRRAIAHDVTPAYSNKLLAALTDLRWSATGPLKIQNPKSKIQNLIEPLSERELEILRLIMAGLSNQEIAQTLVVTVGTVKWHLNNIYGKLDVRSRTQAVARARALELL